MPDTPGGSRRPEEGTPEYEWLYGSSQSGSQDETRVMHSGTPAPGHSDDHPDQTRVMPTAAPPSRPPGGPVTSTQAPPPQPAPSSTPRRRRPLRWVMLLLLLWLVFLLAVPFWAWTKVPKVEAFPDSDRPDEQPGTTYLIVGSDSRSDLTEEERKELSTGNVSGQRTDTIMLLHTGDGPNLLMSIPRDSNVEVPEHGVTKINAAFAYGGPQLLVQTVEQNTGIRIDHYVEIGFGGLVHIVDAVGGVEICPKKDMNDKLAGLRITKGCQEVDGKTALAYSRSRHTSNLGDIDRARNQREVVAAIGKKAASPMSVINPVRYLGLGNAASGSFAVSEGSSPFSLLRFGWAMTRVDGEDGLTCGVPISDLAVTWDAERAPRMFQHIIDDDTAGIPDQLCTPSGMTE